MKPDGSPETLPEAISQIQRRLDAGYHKPLRAAWDIIRKALNRRGVGIDPQPSNRASIILRDRERLRQLWSFAESGAVPQGDTELTMHQDVSAVMRHFYMAAQEAKTA